MTVVQFATKDCKIPPRKDYDLTNEQIASLWYTKTEFKMMRRHVRKLLHQMTEAGADYHHMECLRGLRTREMAFRRMQRVQAVRIAVLREQYIQQMDKEHDVTLLATLSNRITCESRREAVQRGLLDQEAAYPVRAVLDATPSKQALVLAKTAVSVGFWSVRHLEIVLRAWSGKA